MLHCLVVTVSVAFSAGPADSLHTGYGYGGGVAPYGYFDGTGFGGQLYPFDAPEPWQHGYHQEIPAYGGYVAFRPYNYKHVLSQSQAAAGWGMPATMPYSQQFWHRYHNHATMSPATPAQQFAPQMDPPPAPVPTYEVPIYGVPGSATPGLVPPAPLTPTSYAYPRTSNDQWMEQHLGLGRTFR